MCGVGCEALPGPFGEQRENIYFRGAGEQMPNLEGAWKQRYYSEQGSQENKFSFWVEQRSTLFQRKMYPLL